MWRFAVTLSGRGDSQRSGFQSSASSPHVPLWWFAPRILTKISVPAGTWISCISCPSTPRIGIKRGTIVSLLALENNQLNDPCTETYMGLTGGTQSALVESCAIWSTPLCQILMRLTREAFLVLRRPNTEAQRFHHNQVLRHGS